MELCTETGASEFNHRLVQHGRAPVSMSLEITERCNLNCQHCYINLPANDKAARQRELTTAECKRLFDELAEAGTLWLLITGGEIMLRRDFEEIYLYARNQGFILSIYSNATMVTPKRADFLAMYPPHLIEVTLYGATAETYEAVTRVPGSYKKCIDGLRLLAERGLRVQLKTVLLNINSHEFLQMKAIAAEFGWEFRYDGMIHPRLNGDRTPTTLRLSPEELVAVEQLDADRVEEWQEYCDGFLGRQAKGGEKTFNCGAAYQSGHVDAYGMVSPCMITRSRAIDWRSTDFDTVWNGYLAETRETRNTETTACNSCEMSMVCTNCPGWSTLERGTLENRPIEWVCDSTKARVGAFAADAEKWLKNALCLEVV